MHRLSLSQYQELTRNAEVIEKDGLGDKVLILADKTFLKLFRVKSRFSSAWLLPYSVRFARNAQQLLKLGVPCVTVQHCYRISTLDRTAVQYLPLAGKTLRQVFPGLNSKQRQMLAEQAARFISGLHDQGIYFRSLHMGNILQQPDGTLGLIDVADMRFYRRALNKGLRLRNFKHLARYREDVDHLLQDDTFCSVYADLSGLKAEQVVSVIEGG